MRNVFAYCFAWWMITFGIWTALNGIFYSWSPAQGESWSFVFGIGCAIMVVLQWKRKLK